MIPQPRRRINLHLTPFVERVLLQADVPAYHALACELAHRLLATEAELSVDEWAALHRLLDKPARAVLPPGPNLPLSKKQAELLGLVEAAGTIEVADVIVRLWGYRAGGRARLRKLLFDTNNKLRKCDPHQRRIVRKKSSFFSKRYGIRNVLIFWGGSWIW